MGLGDRIRNWIDPPEFAGPPPELAAHYTPPALSAAATSAKPAQHDASSAPAEPDWQAQAWAYYRQCGEARRAVDWIAGAISRCHLFIGEVKEDGSGDPEPAEQPGSAGEVLAELRESAMGESAMLKRLTQHLLITGESWLIGYPTPRGAPTDSDTSWTVCSRHEWALDEGAGTLLVRLADHPDLDADGWVTFPARQVVTVRVHDPDPADGLRATSPFEAALAALDELDGLDARVQADIQSRLAGAGMVEIPESATMPNPAQSDSRGVNPLNGNPLVEGVMSAAKTAIQNPRSPSAVVPIFYTTSDEAAGKSRHISFQTAFDSQIPSLRADARGRVATVLNVPSEILTGEASQSHWNRWLTDSSAVKSYMGPLLTLICDRITRKVLWPALAAAGSSTEQLRTLTIWWDATEIILRPDRSTEALTAQKQGFISGEAARRELGFSEDDAPEEPAASEQPGPGSEPDTQQSGDQQQKDSQTDRQHGGQASPGDRPEPPQGASDGTTGPQPPKQ